MKKWWLYCLIILWSCDTPYHEGASTAEPLYDSKDKLWKHRANSSDQANVALEKFQGVELDVVYDGSEFNVRHDEDDPEGESLEAYLDSIKAIKTAYFWFDAKNLNFWNYKGGVREIHRLFTKFGLFNRAIVESRNDYCLSELAKKGIKSSYWVLDAKYDIDKGPEGYEFAREISRVLSEYKVNAISAHYPMTKYLVKHFPSSNIHIWTNDLITEADKNKIKEISGETSVKVILVDYEDNFLK